MLLGKLSNCKLIKANEQRSCGQKDKYPTSETAKKKKVALQELSEIFHNNESANDKLLKADTNLERINQGTKKIP